MFKSILNLAWKELLQLIRDRVLLVFLIVMPALQLFLIAEATGAGIHNIRLAVWDQERSAFSQSLIDALQNSKDFVIVDRASSYDQVKNLMDEGEVAAALIVPPDFSREALRPGGAATLNAMLDGTNVIVASDVLGSLQGAVNDLVRQQFASVSSGAPPGIELNVEIAFNAAHNIRFSTMPAQLAFIIYQVVLVVAAVGFVRERELGTMEQLAVTPISRLELVLGKGLMVLGLGIANLLLLYATLTLGFQIPMRGSVFLLTALGILFIITEIGVGTLLSLVTSSQQQAVLIVFLMAMLEVTFSGYLVPTDNMPVFMQALSVFSPLQHFTAIVRAVFLKGATLPMLLDHVIPLFLLASGSLAVAWTMFNKMTD